MNREDLLRVWKDFTKGNDFVLNPDSVFVGRVMDGLLMNEQRQGFRLCPCRISDGSRERNTELLCPCNFRAQEIWGKEGRCWCGLFVKRKR